MQDRGTAPPAPGYLPDLRPLLRNWQEQLESALQVGVAFAGVIAILELAIQAPPVDRWQIQVHEQLVSWMGAHLHQFFVSLSLGDNGFTTNSYDIGLLAAAALILGVLVARRR